MVQGVRIIDNLIINENPATGETISQVPCATPTDIEQMVQLANQAQPAWAAIEIDARIQLLHKGLQALATKKELPTTIVQEMGKPIAEANEEVHFATQKEKYLQVLLETLRPKTYGSSVVVRQALGVVSVMSPWNFPADEILLLTLPSLASGNAVIVKPSEVTPETGAIVVKTLAEYLPTGVLQLAQGDGMVGRQLVAHPKVHMVAMTGSSQTGRKILETVAPTLKRCILELGGKDPMVVFEDADIDKAASDAVTYSLSNTGQVCCSIERIYVAKRIYDDFCQRVVEASKTYKVGNGMDPQVKVGPLVSKMQRDLVEAQVQDAVAKGAKLLFQSEVPKIEVSCFYPVTVLSDVTPEMRIYYEETFGPVVVLASFDGTESEAIRLANDTEYGLASCVYTQDLAKARRVSAGIQAGQVGINCYSLENMDARCPWVGHKCSGYGYHSGYDGLLQFSIPKSIIYPPQDSD